MNKIVASVFLYSIFEGRDNYIYMYTLSTPAERSLSAT
jgi:hypothetical protein